MTCTVLLPEGNLMWEKILAIALAGFLTVVLGLPPEAGPDFTTTGDEDKGPGVDPDGLITGEHGSGFDPDGLTTGISGDTGTTR